MALQPSPRQQVHILATVPTQEPAQLGMTHGLIYRFVMPLCLMRIR